SILHLPKDFWPQGAFDSCHRLGIGNLLRPYTSEDPVQQIRADFALQGVKAPIPHVLQYQHPQSNFCRRPSSSACGSVRPPPSQRLVHWLNQFFIMENLVGNLHPRLPAILDAVVDESLAQLALIVFSFDHAVAPDMKLLSGAFI